jgi:hypothetical protein
MQKHDAALDVAVRQRNQVRALIHLARILNITASSLGNGRRSDNNRPWQ